MYIFTNLEVRFLVVRVMIRESVITSPVSIIGKFPMETINLNFLVRYDMMTFE